MAHQRSLATYLGMILMVANLGSWGAWLATRSPLSQGACAVLQAERSERDQAVNSGAPFPSAYVSSQHLLFGRPVRPLGTESFPVQSLYVANALPLVTAWAFVVPSQSNMLGPTCAESFTCGILFLILSSAQWGFVGGLLGYRIGSRRT